MKGRKPKPTQLKVVQGTFRPDRAPQNEPKPRPIAPGCPPEIGDDAREVWFEIAPSLEKLGLLTEVDGPAFAMLCEAQARYRLAQERLRIILSKIGRNPAKHLKTVRMAEVSVEKAEHSFRLLASEFGLSPAARTRLDVSSVPEEDEFEGFLVDAGSRLNRDP